MKRLVAGIAVTVMLASGCGAVAGEQSSAAADGADETTASQEAPSTTSGSVLPMQDLSQPIGSGPISPSALIASLVSADGLAGTEWELAGTYGETGAAEDNPTDCPALDLLFSLGSVPYAAADLVAPGAVAAQTLRSVAPEMAVAIADDVGRAAELCPVVRTVDGRELALVPVPLTSETGFMLEGGNETIVIIVHVADSLVSTLEVGSESPDWAAIEALAEAIRTALAAG